MKGEHAHNWKYNEAKKWIINNQPKWRVVRFCTDCFEIEIVDLLAKV